MTLGGQGSPQRLLGDLRGGPGPPLGGPLGDLGAAFGGRGVPSESTSGKQAALHNHSFACITWYFLAITVVTVAPMRGKVTAMRDQSHEAEPEGP